MSRDDLRIELQTLLKKYAQQCDLSDDACHAIAMTIANVVTSGADTKKKFYEIMRDFAKTQAKESQQKAELILASLDMSDEEKEKLIKLAKGIVEKKGSKVEN